MSNYTLEIKQTLNQSPRSNFGAPTKLTGITVHWWGDPKAGATHNGVVSWLRGPARGTANRGSSAHYVVSGTRVTRLAPESRATWHAGNRVGNGTTIGIEMHPRMSDQDWETLVELCVDIERRHGSMKYYRHMDWKSTACPGVYRTMIAKLVNDVNAALRGSTAKPSAPSKPSTPSYRVKRTNTASGEVKAGPYRASDTIDTLNAAGYSVNVVQTKGSWTQIRNSKGKNGNGWVPTASLNPLFEDQRSSSGIAPVDFISRTTEPGVPVFAGTGSNVDQIGTLHGQGYRVFVTGMKGDTGS